MNALTASPRELATVTATSDQIDRWARMIDTAFFAYSPRQLALVSASVRRAIRRNAGTSGLGAPWDAYVADGALTPVGFGLPPEHALLAASRLRKLAAEMRAA